MDATLIFVLLISLMHGISCEPSICDWNIQDPEDFSSVTELRVTLSSTMNITGNGQKLFNRMPWAFSFDFHLRGEDLNFTLQSNNLYQSECFISTDIRKSYSGIIANELFNSAKKLITMIEQNHKNKNSEFFMNITVNAELFYKTEKSQMLFLQRKSKIIQIEVAQIHAMDGEADKVEEPETSKSNSILNVNVVEDKDNFFSCLNTSKFCSKSFHDFMKTTSIILSYKIKIHLNISQSNINSKIRAKPAKIYFAARTESEASTEFSTDNVNNEISMDITDPYASEIKAISSSYFEVEEYDSSKTLTDILEKFERLQETSKRMNLTKDRSFMITETDTGANNLETVNEEQMQKNPIYIDMYNFPLNNEEYEVMISEDDLEFVFEMYSTDKNDCALLNFFMTTGMSQRPFIKYFKCSEIEQESTPEAMDESVKMLANDESVQKPAVDESVKKPTDDESVRKPAVDAAIKKPAVRESIQKRHIDESVKKSHIDESVQKLTSDEFVKISFSALLKYNDNELIQNEMASMSYKNLNLHAVLYQKATQKIKPFFAKNSTVNKYKKNEMHSNFLVREYMKKIDILFESHKPDHEAKNRRVPAEEKDYLKYDGNTRYLKKRGKNIEMLSNLKASKLVLTKVGKNIMDKTEPKEP